MSTNPLNDIAPWPETEDEVTADTLGRHLAVWAWAHRTHRKTATTDTDREWATSETVNLFSVAKVLRALQVAAPETADEVAKDLWSDLFGGAAVDEWLHAWLTEYGIDPVRVDAAAADLMREAA